MLSHPSAPFRPMVAAFTRYIPTSLQLGGSRGRPHSGRSCNSTLLSGLTITFGTFLPGSISGGVYNDEAVNNLDDPFSSGNPVIAYSPETTAFGATWDLSPGGLGGGLFFQVHLVSGGNVTIPVSITKSGPLFVGWVSDTPFDKILIGTQYLSQETFAMSKSFIHVVVPLPPALPLFASGLAGLGWLSRRRRKAAAEA